MEIPKLKQLREQLSNETNRSKRIVNVLWIIFKYGMVFEIRFNPNKTNIIEFFKTNIDEPTDMILINNKPRKTVQTFNYPGAAFSLV